MKEVRGGSLILRVGKPTDEELLVEMPASTKQQPTSRSLVT